MSCYYDLHIHSCLSPCADDDMTPNNILNMSILTGLDMIALTDHNTCRNCPAIFEAAQNAPVTVLAGMELTTAEEVHAVCLFSVLDAAMAFDAYVYERLPDIKNRRDIFGPQQIMDGSDNVTGEQQRLLVSATSISINELPKLMREYSGICWPAHIDRDSYSILSNLGFIPPECGFGAVEVAAPDVFFADSANASYRSDYHVLTSSDAHVLEAIHERSFSLPLERHEFLSLSKYLKTHVE